MSGAGEGLLDMDRLKAALYEEIAVAAAQSDASPMERFVAEALCSDDAKSKGLVDRVWVVSLPDARKAIEAVAAWNRRAAPADQTDGAGLREAVARVIDPLLFELTEALNSSNGEPEQLRADATAHRDRKAVETYAKADAILALTGNPSLHVSENGGGDDGEAVVILRKLADEAGLFRDAPAEACIWLGGWSTYSGARDSTLVHVGDICAALSTPATLAQGLVPTARAGDVSGLMVVGAVIAAARNMPRRTPKIGGCSTIHDVQIEACHIWALDKALTEYDAALSKPSTDGATQ